VEHAEIFETELILAKLAQPLAAVEDDIARGRLEIAAQDFHERRLAAAVGADQAVAIAVAELDRDVLEQGLGAELHRDVGRGEQDDSVRCKRLAAHSWAREAKPAILLEYAFAIKARVVMPSTPARPCIG